MALALAFQASAGYVAPLVPARALARAEAPQMIKSKAIPFLEAPPLLDGSMPGDRGFDPFDLSSGIDIKWLREAELKHGRVCMIAWAGWVAVDLGLIAPGAPKVSSLEAHDAAVKSGAMLFLLGLIGCFEAVSYPAVADMMSGESDREPGDFCLDPFGWAKGDKLRMRQEQELEHGRLAMLAFSGVVTQSALFNVGFPYQSFGQ